MENKFITASKLAKQSLIFLNKLCDLLNSSPPLLTWPFGFLNVSHSLHGDGCLIFSNMNSLRTPENREGSSCFGSRNKRRQENKKTGWQGHSVQQETSSCNARKLTGRGGSETPQPKALQRNTSHRRSASLSDAFCQDSCRRNFEKNEAPDRAE